MRAIATTSKIVLVTALMSVAIAGCGRREANQASGAASSSGTASGTAAGTSSDATQGASGSSTAPSSIASGTNGSSSSVGAAIDDSIITTKVKSALLADEDVKGTDITVATKQGEVMLTGFAGNKAQIDKAVKIASAVEGVKKVDNKMAVKQ